MAATDPLLGSVGGWGCGVGLVVFLEAGLDGSFPDAEPLGHAVHGDSAGAGGGEGGVYLGRGLGSGLFRLLVVVPGLEDELVEVGVVWVLLAGGHDAAGVGLVWMVPPALFPQLTPTKPLVYTKRLVLSVGGNTGQSDRNPTPGRKALRGCLRSGVSEAAAAGVGPKRWGLFVLWPVRVG